MNFVNSLFYFFMFAAAMSAVGVLFSNNVFKAALSLLVCLLSIAAIFILSFAEFVAVTQILVYAAGVVVLIIFGIMLTSKLSTKPLQVSNTNIFSGIFLSLSILAILINLIITFEVALPASKPIVSNTIETIGINLMTTFILPFEIVGILLLITLVGAAVLTSFLKQKKL